MKISKKVIRNKNQIEKKVNKKIREIELNRYYKRFKLYKYKGKKDGCSPIQRLERESRKFVLQKDKNSRFLQEKDSVWRGYKKDNDKEDSNFNNVKIMCMGDMLCEERLYKNSSHDGNFDFYSVFKAVREILEKSDLSIANLTTLVDEKIPFTGEQNKIGNKYHNNAPVEFLDAVKYAGIDFLTMANNHNLDGGISGIENTLNQVDCFKFIRTGLFMPEEKRYQIVEIKGIRIAILSYSTIYNSNLGRLNKRGREIIINEYGKEKIEREIRQAKIVDEVDFVLVYMYWGEDSEYKQVASKRQKQIAKEIANAGADYIVGSHPHCLQEFEIIELENGRNVCVAYSLGNFVTSDYHTISRDTAILVIELEKKNGLIEVESKYIPCHVFNNFDGNIGMIVPSCGDIESQELKYQDTLKHSFNISNDILGSEIDGYGFDTPSITYYKICNWLGIKKEQKNTNYTGLRYPMDAIPGCIAITTKNTADRNRKPTLKEQYEMAEVCRKKGAKAIITTEKLEGYDCIVVDDIMEAYITIASRYREYFKPKTIGITGSIGKTTTTEIINTVLKSKFNTHWNGSSANNLRLASNVVQGLKKQHEVYVQEIMEGPPFGVAEAISEISKPEIGVVTVVGSSHFEAFGSQERIWESCLGIQGAMPDGKGVMIINGDDSMQKKEDINNRKVIVYGIENKSADVRAENIKSTIDGIYFNIIFEGREIPAFMKVIGKHNVLNALAAFAAGKEYGMTDNEIVSALRKYRTSGIRQNLISYNGYNIYLDCYNSAYESIVSLVKSMDDIEFNHKKIAVIGDVLELGDISEKSHRDIGRCLGVANSLDLVIFYGKHSKLSFEECKALGKNCLWSENEDDLVELIKNNSSKKDLLIFKGSHGMKLEYVADRIFGTWNYEQYQRFEYKCTYKSNDNFKYTNYNDHITLTKYIGDLTEVDIPGEIDGIPVTGIGESCFSNNETISTVIVPENVKNIRYCAFYNCGNLEKIELPESLLIIGRSAFSTCKKLKKIHLGSNVTDIFYRAFSACENLEEINIPESCMHLGGEVFRH